jgi:hypothetical protein
MTRQKVSTDRNIKPGFGQVRGRRQRGGIPRYYTIQEVAEQFRRWPNF